MDVYYDVMIDAVEGENASVVLVQDEAFADGHLVAEIDREEALKRLELLLTVIIAVLSVLAVLVILLTFMLIRVWRKNRRQRRVNCCKYHRPGLTLQVAPPQSDSAGCQSDVTPPPPPRWHPGAPAAGMEGAPPFHRGVGASTQPTRLHPSYWSRQLPPSTSHSSTSSLSEVGESVGVIERVGHAPTERVNPVTNADVNSEAHAAFANNNVKLGPHHQASEPIYQEIMEIVPRPSLAYPLDKIKKSASSNSLAGGPQQPVSSAGEPPSVNQDNSMRHGNVLYSMITAKEVARFVPCSQNLILRDS